MNYFFMIKQFTLKSVISLSFVSLVIGCFPGAVIDKGGFVDHAGLLPEATRIQDAEFNYVCKDEQEINRRLELAEAGEPIPNEPPVQFVSQQEYKGGCELEGESSQFYLFHLWPVTAPIDPAYALGIPVQSVEGDTMIDIKSWHETHYYSILGHVRVFKVKGDVIRFNKKTK